MVSTVRNRIYRCTNVQLAHSELDIKHKKSPNKKKCKNDREFSKNI